MNIFKWWHAQRKGGSKLLAHTSVREDCRPLSEFYPDPFERRQVHYTFAHRFLPQYVHDEPEEIYDQTLHMGLPEGSSDGPTRYIQSRWCLMEERLGLLPEGQGLLHRRVNDLAAWLGNASGKTVIYVQMPNPDPPGQGAGVGVLAFFVAIAAENRASARVLTLEDISMDHPDMPFGAQAMLCEWTIKEHISHELVIEPKREAFISAVAELLAEKPGQEPESRRSQETNL